MDIHINITLNNPCPIIWDKKLFLSKKEIELHYDMSKRYIGLTERTLESVYKCNKDLCFIKI